MDLEKVKRCKCTLWNNYLYMCEFVYLFCFKPLPNLEDNKSHNTCV